MGYTAWDPGAQGSMWQTDARALWEPNDLQHLPLYAPWNVLPDIYLTSFITSSRSLLKCHPTERLKLTILYEKASLLSMP